MNSWKNILWYPITKYYLLCLSHVSFMSFSCLSCLSHVSFMYLCVSLMSCLNNLVFNSSNLSLQRIFRYLIWSLYIWCSLMFDHHSVCETGLQLAILFGHVTLVGCHMLWNSQKCMITSTNVMYNFSVRPLHIAFSKRFIVFPSFIFS